ncbi:hypothetical protein C8Q76DRAFT_790912 [Earliella scabrosa]|nr:hypothetical protein C8Q76DRAFT_790912 [Earliella scabrosa]
MSDSTFATEFWSSTVANYCGLAATTILVYEYLLKFPDEVELFWKRKWTGASVLFFTNRSIALLHQVLANVNVLVLTKEAYVKTDIIIDLLQYVPWAGFAALRAYALSFNYGISGLILALSMVPIAGVGSAMYDNQGVVIPELGCLTLSLASTQVAVRGAFITIATRSALILADLMAICVTWLALHRQYNGILGKHTLQYILMRDGTVQFTWVMTWIAVSTSTHPSRFHSVLLVLNTLYLVFGVLSASLACAMTNTDGLQYTSYVLIFTEPWVPIPDVQTVTAQ